MVCTETRKRNQVRRERSRPATVGEALLRISDQALEIECDVEQILGTVRLMISVGDVILEGNVCHPIDREDVVNCFRGLDSHLTKVKNGLRQMQGALTRERRARDGDVRTAGKKQAKSPEGTLALNGARHLPV